MNVKTEKLEHKELIHLQNLLQLYERRFWKLFGTAVLIVGLPLVIPTSILALARGNFIPPDESVVLLIEFGPMNVVYFVMMPALIIFLLIYLFLFKIPFIRKDIRKQEKLVGKADVREIMKLDINAAESFMGTYDYKTVFAINDYNLTEITFSSLRNPECLSAKAYTVEVSKYAKIHLKREIDNS